MDQTNDDDNEAPSAFTDEGGDPATLSVPGRTDVKMVPNWTLILRKIPLIRKINIVNSD